jgi:GT2 family glycosyltransferase
MTRFSSLQSHLTRSRPSVLLRTFLAILRRDGLSAVTTRLIRWLRGERRFYQAKDRTNTPHAYRIFRSLFEPDEAALQQQREEAAAIIKWINFSIVALAQTEHPDTQFTLDSLRAQTYPHWSTDDMTGDWYVRLNAGDELAPFALFAMAKAIRAFPDAIALYADEDQLDQDFARRSPQFKPDYSPEGMISQDLFEGLCAFRSDLPVEPTDRALGYRLAELLEHGGRAVHIPQILVHRRTPAARPEAAFIADHLRRTGIENPHVTVNGGIVRAGWEPKPRTVGIIIPSLDKPDVISRCLSSLFRLTANIRFHVIIVDTGSTDPRTQAVYDQYAADERFRVVRYRGETFNFGRACNQGAAASDAELLLFLNNDTEILHPDWLARMAQWLDRDKVGVVGAKLLYPNGRLQHAGVIVGLNGMASHLFGGEREHTSSIFGTDDAYRNFSAVTGACLLTRRDVYEAVGGWDERYPLNYSDVQFCLDAIQKGYRVVYTPDARLIHHESISRGSRVPKVDFEIANERWADILTAGDPFYNPNLSFRTTFPNLRQSHEDTAAAVNRYVMSRLPADRDYVIVPDDLV